MTQMMQNHRPQINFCKMPRVNKLFQTGRISVERKYLQCVRLGTSIDLSFCVSKWQIIRKDCVTRNQSTYKPIEKNINFTPFFASSGKLNNSNQQQMAYKIYSISWSKLYQGVITPWLYWFIRTFSTKTCARHMPPKMGKFICLLFTSVCLFTPCDIYTLGYHHRYFHSLCYEFSRQPGNFGFSTWSFVLNHEILYRC